MSLSALEQRLAVAQQRIIEGIKPLSRQEELIAGLERDGRETDDALQQLKVLRDTQKLHEQEAECIMRESKQKSS